SDRHLVAARVPDPGAASAALPVGCRPHRRDCVAGAYRDIRSGRPGPAAAAAGPSRPSGRWPPPLAGTAGRVGMDEVGATRSWRPAFLTCSQGTVTTTPSRAGPPPRPASGFAPET